MGTVGTGFSMSLDGFIARKNDDIGPLFDWMTKGQTEYTLSTGDHNIDLKLAGASVEMFEDAIASTGALLCGRHLFDITNGWGGEHPLHVPVVVLTHSAPTDESGKEGDFRGNDAYQRFIQETPTEAGKEGGSRFTFVTEGFEAALARAREIAGDKNVAIASTTLAQECLNLGLMDEIHIDLVHVLLGDGKRLFDNLNISDTDLELVAAKNAPGVTHMTFKVLKKK